MKRILLCLLASSICASASYVTVRNYSGSPVVVGDYQIDKEARLMLPDGDLAISRTGRVDTVTVAGDGFVNVGLTQTTWEEGGTMKPFWQGMSLGCLIYGFLYTVRIVKKVGSSNPVTCD